MPRLPVRDPLRGLSIDDGSYPVTRYIDYMSATDTNLLKVSRMTQKFTGTPILPTAFILDIRLKVGTVGQATGVHDSSRASNSASLASSRLR